MPSIVTFFPVNNGDTTLICTPDKTVLVDIHNRDTSSRPDGEIYDIAPDIREACRTRSGGGRELDVFVLTHPDKDHLGGAENLLHLGKPSDYDSKDDTVFVNEIWTTSHVVDDARETEHSKEMLVEIRRRNTLKGTSDAGVDGNRLRVLNADDDETSAQLGANLTWQLLAPNKIEVEIPAAKPNEEPLSSNDSSLVINWKIGPEGNSARFLLGGDAGYGVWKRLEHDHGNNDDLSWDVLLAPHHCSRSAMAWKDPETENYSYEQEAIDAMSHVASDGFIVASSKPVKNDDDNPPSWDARKKYLEILKKAEPAQHENRFLNPESHSQTKKPAPVVFEIDDNGLRQRAPQKAPANEKRATRGAVVPGEYG